MARPDGRVLCTERLMRLARAAGKRVHVLHVATSEEIPILARHKDVATAEVTPIISRSAIRRTMNA